MSGTPFAELTPRQQRAEVRPMAWEVLRQYPIEPIELRLVNHGFNTTYRVVTRSGSELALRINVNSHRTPEEMKGEVAWVSALAEEFNPASDQTIPRFPAPLACSSGEMLATVHSDALGRELRAVVYTWLPGKGVPEKVPGGIAARMGSAMRWLHRHGATFRPPSGACLEVLQNSLLNRSYRLDERAPQLDHSALRAVIAESDAIIARQMRLGPILTHSDLHMGNVKWDGTRLAVFDFDDSMESRPILDAAISDFYLRRSGPRSRLAFWKGLVPNQSDPLASALEEHGLSAREFEVLVASRAIGLANELFNMVTAEFQDLAPKYADAVNMRIAHLLKTGVYDPSVATV